MHTCIYSMWVSAGKLSGGQGPQPLVPPALLCLGARQEAHSARQAKLVKASPC